MGRYTGSREDNDLNITLNAEHEGTGEGEQTSTPVEVEEPIAVSDPEPEPIADVEDNSEELNEGEELSQALESLQAIYATVAKANDWDTGNESYLQLLNVSVDNAVRRMGTNAAELSIVSAESYVFDKQVSLEKIGEAISNGLKSFWEWVKKVIKSIGERIKGWFSRKSTVEGKAKAADAVVSEFEAAVKKGEVTMVETKSTSETNEVGTVYQLTMKEKRQPGSSKPEQRETGSKEPILMGTTVKPEQKIKLKLPAYYRDASSSSVNYHSLVGVSAIVYRSISQYLNGIVGSISKLEQTIARYASNSRLMDDEMKATILTPILRMGESEKNELFNGKSSVVYMGVTLSFTEDDIFRGHLASGSTSRVTCEMTTKEIHKIIDYMENGWVTRNIPRMEGQMKDANAAIQKVVQKVEEHISKIEDAKIVNELKKDLNYSLKQLTNIEMIVNLLLRNYEVLLNAVVKATKLK